MPLAASKHPGHCPRRLDKSKYDLQGRDEQVDHQVLNRLYTKISLNIKQTWGIWNVMFVEKRKLK